jgi:hypothetical protein
MLPSLDAARLTRSVALVAIRHFSGALDGVFVVHVQRGGASALPPQQLRQLGDVGGDAPGLVAREQTGSRPSARFIFEIHVGQRLPVGVADDEAGVGLLGGPGRQLALKAPHQ